MALHSSSYESIHQDYGSEPPKPRKSSGGLTLLLVVAFALIAAFFIPSVRARINKFFPSETAKRVEMGVQVWANKDAGNYYCATSKFFGRGTGSYMRQGDALTLGYQPALGNYCQQSNPVHSNTLVRSTERPPHSTGSPSNTPAREDARRR
jgi:hypothetical protein